MSVKLPADSIVLGYARQDLIFIIDCLDMLDSSYSAFDNDSVLKFHYDAIINRLYELADIPTCSNGCEFYIAVVESVD